MRSDAQATQQRKVVVDLVDGGIFSNLYAYLFLRPWHWLRDLLVVAAYWTLDYFTDLLFWSLQLLSSMPNSPHEEGRFTVAVASRSDNISLDTSPSMMNASPSEQMDVTLVSPIFSDSSEEADRKTTEKLLLDTPPWDMCSSTSTASLPSSPSGLRNLKLLISPPGSPGDPHIDRTDHEHCLQSPFSDDLRSGTSIDDFHSSLMSAVSSELIESSSSFLREDLRIASHSPLNFRLSRDLTPDYFPSLSATIGASQSLGSVPPSPPAAPPHRPPQARRSGSTRSFSVGSLSHEDKENIAPTSGSPSTPPDASPRLRRATLRRGYSSFRSPRL